MSNSYGTSGGVANYVRQYTHAGAFDSTTLPTETAVNAWIGQVSAMVNTGLAAYGFSIPVTQPDAVLSITSTVEQLVAELCQAANSAGRFFSDRALQAGISPWKAIRLDVQAWIQASAGGLEALGAARTIESNEVRIGFRDSDSTGQPTAPIFQRRGFGNQFQDWDQSPSPAQGDGWPDGGGNPGG